MIEWNDFRRAAHKGCFNWADIAAELDVSYHEIMDFKELNGLPSKLNPAAILTQREFIELYKDCDNNFQMAEILGCKREHIDRYKETNDLKELNRKSILKRKYDQLTPIVSAMLEKGVEQDVILFELSIHPITLKKIMSNIKVQKDRLRGGA